MIWYIDYIKEQLLFAKSESFEGHLDFQVNFKSGEIRNINVSINKSVKKPKEQICQNTEM